MPCAAAGPRKRGDAGAKGFEALGLDRIGGALADDEGALPVVAAVEHDEGSAGLDAAEHGARLLGTARQLEPQHVHGRAQVPHLEARRGPQRRVPAVGGDDEIGAHLQVARRRSGDHAGDALVVADEIDRLGLHHAA